MVSVIIPMYNSEGTIIRALNSVCNQDYKNFEVIIINDGSRDNSKFLIENFIEENNTNKIRLINQENSGVSVARNRGIIEAKGEYIAFLDSDDVWENNKLSTQINIMEKNKDIFLLSTLLISDKNKKSTNIIKDISFKKLLFKNYFMTSTVVIKKQVFETVGYFNTNKNHSEDYELWLRISERFRTSIFMGKLTTYSLDNNGLSSNLIKMQKGEIENYFELYKNKKISIFMFLLVIMFSSIKFSKRLIFKYIERTKELQNET